MICERCQSEVESCLPNTRVCHSCAQNKRKDTLLARSDKLTEKECVQCHTIKPLEDYFADKRMTGKGGKNSSCKACQKLNRQKWSEENREYQTEYFKDYYQKNKRAQQGKRLEKKYGITIDDYEAILVAQKGACAVCCSVTARGNGKFHVDHDHKTGKVRGLLCHDCNVGLGNFKDSPELLEAASTYLRRLSMSGGSKHE